MTVGVASETPISGIRVPSRLSFSGAALYRKCPKAWRMKYHDKLPEPPSDHTFLGSFGHQTLELGKRAELGPDPNEWRPVAGEVWNKRVLIEDADAPPIEERKGPTLHESFTYLAYDADQIKRFKHLSWGHIERVAPHIPDLGLPIATTFGDGIEVGITVTFAGVPFYAGIDLLSRIVRQATVTDHKTGAVPDFTSPYFAEKVDQPLLYAEAAKVVCGESIDAQLLYTAPDPVLLKPIDVAQGPAAVDRLADTWAKINDSAKRNDFPARPQALCGWCPHAFRCPEGLRRVLERMDENRGGGPAGDAFHALPVTAQALSMRMAKRAGYRDPRSSGPVELDPETAAFFAPPTVDEIQRMLSAARKRKAKNTITRLERQLEAMGATA